MNFHEQLAEHFEKMAGHYILMTQEQVINPIDEETGELIMPSESSKPVTKAFISGSGTFDDFFQQLFPLLQTCEQDKDTVMNAVYFCMLAHGADKNIQKIMQHYMMKINNDGKVKFKQSINNTLTLMREYGATETAKKAVAIMCKIELVGHDKLSVGEQKLLLDSLTLMGKEAYTVVKARREANGEPIPDELKNAGKTLDEMQQLNDSLDDLIEGKLKDKIRDEISDKIPKGAKVILGMEELKNLPPHIRREMLDTLKQIEDEEHN